MGKIEKLKELTELLQKASYAYYGQDNPIMSDKKYDELYDELSRLEGETGCILAGSPTQKVQGYVLNGFKKVEHSKPMLSANKTKDIDEIKKFVGDEDFYCSYKLDGCFDKCTKIIMSDMTLKKISEIQVGDTVKSFDENTGELKDSKVINVFYNGKKEDSEWIRLRLNNNRNINGTRHHITCTKNHKFFTPNGWIEAQNLTIGSSVYYYDYKISLEQKQFLLGSLLGDGWFVNRSDNTNSLDLHYSKTNKYPYDIFISYISNLFNFNNPSINNHISGFGSDIININLHSMTLPNIFLNQKNWKRCGLTFTKEICDSLTPLALAIFYIDDGSKTPCMDDGNYLTFNKQVRCQLALNRHSFNEVVTFSNWLNNKGYYNNYSFEKDVITENGGDGYHIIMTVDGTNKFFDDICQYISYEIRKIKLGLKDKWQKCNLIKWWECTGEYALTTGEIGNVENGCRRRHTKGIRDRKIYNESYDLEIENNHTYFAEGYAVHNCTLVVKYMDGKFIQGITRGNGLVGEDVTEQCKFIKNLPMQISNKNPIELRGECVINWEEFRRINTQLEEPYSHPRNLAAGTLRNLNLNIVKERNLSFIVFEMVSPHFTYKWDGLKALDELGFECVGRARGKVEDCIEGMQPEFYKYPTDGLIYEINNSEMSKSMGATAHHECCRMALKWEDELYNTILKDIEWNTSKTGLINPVAVFEPVDLDGAITTRATLHNISYIEDLQLGIGDTIQVYRANMVIPKVHENLTRSSTWKLPDKCSCCGGEVEIHNENGSKTLHCTNPDCKAKLLGKLTHFVSKNAINIDGLSEQTLQKFIDFGWLNSFKDIYYLSEHKEEIYKFDGFGKKSVDKLLESIDKSRNTTLDRFIYALSIPLIGRTASKDISKYCNNNIDIFIKIMIENKISFVNYIDGFGDTMYKSLCNWWNEYCLSFVELSKEFYFEAINENNNNDVNLLGKIFVITGSLNHYKNRDELVAVIERLGGKVAGSVSKKTSFLINNNITSNSSKNKKSRELGIPIITEENFNDMIS